MAQITLAQWRNDWRNFTHPPDADDREREQTFLRDHARYGARIHRDTADVLAEALDDERLTTRRHTLFLRLFAEYANALESLGAFGWAIRNRRDFRMFLDGFLSYPHDAPGQFYRRVVDHNESLTDVLALPPRARVIRAVRELAPGGGTARESAEYLDTGILNVRESAEQYFTHNSVLLTHYNKAKHGATMLRLARHSQNELDFQVIAPQRQEDVIAAGAWYDIGLFQASDDMVGRVRRNVEAVTGSIQQLAIIAWALYSAELFYADPAGLP